MPPGTRAKQTGLDRAAHAARPLMLPPNADAEASGQGPSVGRARGALWESGRGCRRRPQRRSNCMPCRGLRPLQRYSCRVPRLQSWFPSYWRTGRGGRWRRCRQLARPACGPGRRRAWLIKGVRSPLPMSSDDGLTRAFAWRSRSVRPPSRRCCASPQAGASGATVEALALTRSGSQPGLEHRPHTVSKTVVGPTVHRGFESLPLRLSQRRVRRELHHPAGEGLHDLPLDASVLVD
jgi:hypothetical protein